MRRRRGEKAALAYSGRRGFTFARPLGAIGPVFMVGPFPGLPSQHNEPHYSGLLAATIAGLFHRDTVKSSIKTHQGERQEGRTTQNKNVHFTEARTV